MHFKLAVIRIGKAVLHLIESSPELAVKLWLELCDIVRQIRQK